MRPIAGYFNVHESGGRMVDDHRLIKDAAYSSRPGIPQIQCDLLGL